MIQNAVSSEGVRGVNSVGESHGNAPPDCEMSGGGAGTDGGEDHRKLQEEVMPRIRANVPAEIYKQSE